MSPDRRRVRLPRTAPDHEDHRRCLERNGLTSNAGPRIEQLPRPQLHRLAIADEACPSLDDEIQLLLLFAFAKLVMGNHEQLSLMRLRGVHAERLDTEKSAHC